MGYAETKEKLGELNDALATRYRTGEPVVMNVVGKPQLRIESFEPLVYEKYGSFRNKPPHVNGAVVLRAVLSHPGPEGGAVLYTAVEAGSQGYGFVLDGHNPRNRAALSDVAMEVGIPDFIISPIR